MLAEHTAEDRLAYIVGKVAGVAVPLPGPSITMVGKAGDGKAIQALAASYRCQTYPGKRLVLVTTAEGIAAGIGDEPGIRIMSEADAGTARAIDLCGEDGWLAPLRPQDHYGPSYLCDLALATRYAPGTAIGKAAYFARGQDGTIALHGEDQRYRIVDSVPACAGIIRAPVLTESVAALLADIDGRRFAGDAVLSIDTFNYCRDGGGDDASVSAAVDDLPGLDTGLDYAAMTAAAEAIRLIERPIDGLSRIEGNRLATMFRSGPFVTFTEEGGRLRIDSKLAPNQKRQRYTRVALTPGELGVVDGILRAHLVATSDLMIRVGLRFVDDAGEEIGAGASNINRDMEFDLPEGTAGIHVGVRIIGPGSAHVGALILGHRFLEPAIVLSHGDVLILTDGFPSYDDPGQGREAYKAAIAARAAGRRPDVFRLAPVAATAYHEYEGFDCITGTEGALTALIAAGRHHDAEVLATDPATRPILTRYAERLSNDVGRRP